jgi:copper chaperone
MIITRELTAPAMSCGHCKMTIEKAVKGLEGIAKVNADPATKKVTVEFDESSTTIDDIKHAIEDAGYATEIETDIIE